MHKGVILLCKAEDKHDAISQVNDFMEPYGEGDVWDWFQIGGRWNNALAPKDKLAEWSKKADALLKKDGREWVSQQDIDDNQATLQGMWKDCGLDGMGGETYTIPMNLENYIDELVCAYLKEKDIKRFEKKKQKDMLTGLLWGDEEGYRTVTWKKPMTIAILLKMPKGRAAIKDTINKLKAKYPDKKLLNTNIPNDIL